MTPPPSDAPDGPARSPLRPATSVTPFVGRERELDELAAGLDDAARSARGALFLIGGDAGIGKTRLASELAARVTSPAARVLWGRCWEGEGAPAFWPWVQMIRAYTEGRARADLAALLGAAGAHLAHIVPELREQLGGELPALSPTALESDNARFYLFDSVSGFFRAASRREPLLLIFDDLHWADTPSLRLLRFLARDLNACGILAVATYRESEISSHAERSELLGELARDARRIPLRGLDEAGVATLARQQVGSPLPEPLVVRIHQATDGNPFFVDEIVQLLAVEGTLRDGGSAESLKIPEGVRHLIRRRLALLPRDCRDLLANASVIGREFDFALLARVSGVGVEPVTESLAEACTHAIVSEASGRKGRYRFAHALLRETLYEDLPLGRRAELHATIAEALAGEGAAGGEPLVAEIAHHFAKAAPAGADPRAVEWTRRAGDQAMRQLAYEEAIRHFRIALEVLAFRHGEGGSERCDVLQSLGEAQRRAGDRSGARASFEEAAALARRLGPPERFAATVVGVGLASAAVESYEGGKVDQPLVALLEQALEALPAEDGALRARLLGRLAAALYFAPDSRARRQALAGEAVGVARRVGEPAGIAAALNSKRYALWGPDDLDERLTEATEILALAEAARDRERELQARQWRLWDLLEKGDRRAADLEMAAHAALAEAIRQPLYLGYAAMFRGMRALLEGRFAEGEALAQEAFTLAERANPEAATLYGAQTFRASWELGRREFLEAAVGGLLSDMTALPAARCATAFLLAELGRLDEARVEFERFARTDFAALPEDLGWLLGMATLSRACCMLGDSRRAELLYQRLLPYRARRNILVGPPAADSFGPVAYYLGILAAQAGNRELAREHLKEAVEAAAEMGGRPFVAEAEVAEAETWLADGDRDRAAVLLARALATARALGMTRLAERIERLAVPLPAAEKRSAPSADDESWFERSEGEWTLAYGGTRCRVRDAKGLGYLAVLLRHPGRDLHVVDLVSEAEALERPEPSASADSVPPLPGLTDTVREQLESLRSELVEADSWGDRERARRLREQIEIASEEIASAYGLGERSPAAGSDHPDAASVERQRKAVTNRIRDAIARIRPKHPALAAHLETSVRTGTVCRYAPEPVVSWRS